MDSEDDFQLMFPYALFFFVQGIGNEPSPVWQEDREQKLLFCYLTLQVKNIKYKGHFFNPFESVAEVAELADALDSGSSGE